MRKFILPLVASLAVATPALANEARVEARGGVVWDSGNTEAIAGIAAGYDFDLGGTAFTGLEISADKILASGSNLVGVGFSGRVGAKLAATKVFVSGGYTTKYCTACDGSWNIGAGAELPLMGPLYGKVEYKRYFIDNAADGNTATVGLGYKF
jgi:outer membrane immunogenic protein